MPLHNLYDKDCDGIAPLFGLDFEWDSSPMPMLLEEAQTIVSAIGGFRCKL